MTIQQYKADSLNINMFSEFYGFEIKKKNQQNQEGLDFMIEGDEMRFKQVLMNIQSNALKFTRSGGKVKIIATYVKSLQNQREGKKILKMKNKKDLLHSSS